MEKTNIEEKENKPVKVNPMCRKRENMNNNRYNTVIISPRLRGKKVKGEKSSVQWQSRSRPIGILEKVTCLD